MLKKSVLSVTVTTFTLLSLGNLVLCQITQYGDDCGKKSIYRKWLDYSILSDTVIDDQRKVEVLLGQRTFSECELRWIFESVAKRYGKPEELLVTVRNTMSDDEKGPWSLYLRRDRGEGFQYRPNGSHKGVKTVILKGTDPFDKKKKQKRPPLPVSQVYTYPKLSNRSLMNTRQRLVL